MGDVSVAINKYIIENIRLTKSDISKAAASREWFLKRIEKVIDSRSNEPTLCSPKFVKFGSYFKGTKVQAVDEFDILVVIDSNTGVFSVGGNGIGDGQGVAEPNHKYDSKFKKNDDSGVSPTKLLNWLQSVVKEVTDAFYGEAPIRNGQAVTATIKSKDLKIDLVPAGIFKRNSDNAIFYNIPNGKQNNSWTQTFPPDDIKVVNEVAEGKENFKNAIRIVKRIKDTYNFNVSSFAIESAIVDYGKTHTWYNILFYNIVGVLNHLIMSFRNGKIQDPYDSTTNLISEVDSLEWYADRIKKIVDTLNECHENTSENQENTNLKVFNSFENK